MSSPISIITIDTSDGLQYGISPEWIAFLAALTKKADGVPLTSFQNAYGEDLLTIIIGDGNCVNYLMSGTIFPGANILLKRFPQPQEDPFVGIVIWGGIGGLVRRHYQTLLGDKFALFQMQHNAQRTTFTIAELLDLCLARVTPSPLYDTWRARILQACADQSPHVHIPL